MKKFFLFSLLLLLTVTASAQNANTLSPNDLIKVSKSEAVIADGESYLKDSQAYLESIKSLKTRGKYYTKDSLKLTKQYQRARLEAYTFLDDGYEDLYKTYYKAVEKANLLAANSKVDDYVQAAKISHKNGRKFFSKVPDEMDKKKAVTYMDLGVENEKSAIARLRDAVNVLSGGAGRSDNSIVLATPTIQQTTLNTDSLIGKPKQAQIVEVVIPVARIDSSSLISNAPKSMDNATTFFTIQIEASKVKLSQQQVSFKYRGTYLVVMMEGDGYYRYSIGKFASVADAQAVIDSEKIKGYIVGYHNNKRVAIAEVTKALTIK